MELIAELLEAHTVCPWEAEWQEQKIYVLPYTFSFGMEEVWTTRFEKFW